MEISSATVRDNSYPVTAFGRFRTGLGEGFLSKRINHPAAHNHGNTIVKLGHMAQTNISRYSPKAMKMQNYQHSNRDATRNHRYFRSRAISEEHPQVEIEVALERIATASESIR